MMTKYQVQKLLEDIKTVYLVGYSNNDLDSETEMWGQIQILEWILSK